MRKDSMRGWKQVFGFTLTQTLKSKAYIVTLVIMMILAMVSMPLMNALLLNGVTEGPEKSSIEKVYLYNMTMFRSMDIESELTDAYKHVVIQETSEDAVALEQRICEEEQNAVILYLIEDEQNCYIQFLRSPEGDVTTYELQLLGQSIQNAYTKAPRPRECPLYL